MSFDWESVFASGFGELLQSMLPILDQPILLLANKHGPILWPFPERNQPPKYAWAQPLTIDEQTIGYLVGTGAIPTGCQFLISTLQERIQSILLGLQLNQSQARLIEEIKAHTELEEALKFMELKALQSQVNPHFLFNTLTTIAGLATLESAEQTVHLVHALSRLLRYSLRKIAQTVTLEEELTHVYDYLAIQQARFGDRIMVKTEMNTDILLAQIPVLTLQPLVENAIIHGLEAVEAGQLSLVGYGQQERVIIHIIDNGQGIAPERLAEIKAMRAEISGRSHTTGLGFNNVHKRLQHFFGSSYGLQLESVLGQGTQVTVTIPLVE